MANVYPSAENSVNISDVIEAIQSTDPDFCDNSMAAGYAGGGAGYGGGEGDAPQNGAYVEILEQPASKALRFRYECEGRSAGSIPGVHSTPENKTFPSIQVKGYKGRAVVVVSCVTKDFPHRPHPHNLVGKEGCKKGVCTMDINSDNMVCTFSNLGIQCVKKKDIEEALRLREDIRVDPFQTGFAHRSQPTNIDLNAVRLCFQVFLEASERGKFTLPLQPVVSEPIFDKKAMSDLVICKLSHSSCSVAGGKELILLCEKVAKEDIQVHFYEESEGQMVWEGFGDFQPSHVHKQVAISFRTPKYKVLEITSPIKLFIELRRPSDGATSEPRPFEYTPLESGRPFWALKKAKGNYGIFSNILATNAALVASSRPMLGVPSTLATTEPSISLSVPPSAGTSVAVPKDLTTDVGGKDFFDSDEVMEVRVDGGNIASQSDSYDYAQVNKRSSQIISEQTVQKMDEESNKEIKSELRCDEMSQAETFRSLNDILSQVADLEGIYPENGSDACIMETSPSGHDTDPEYIIPESPKLDNVPQFSMDTSEGAYTSLQLAMKNPILVEFPDDLVQPLTPNTNKREMPALANAKLPPLPPKRIRKVRPDEMVVEDCSIPPAIPPKPASSKQPPQSAPVVSSAPPTLASPKPSKGNLFHKLFSKRSKEDKSQMKKSASTEVVSELQVSPPKKLSASPSVPALESSSSLMELTEAEHLALYTDVAPRASVSEIDDIETVSSLYCSAAATEANPSDKQQKRRSITKFPNSLLDLFT